MDTIITSLLHANFYKSHQKKFEKLHKHNNCVKFQFFFFIAFIVFFQTLLVKELFLKLIS